MIVFKGQLLPCGKVSGCEGIHLGSAPRTSATCLLSEMKPEIDAAAEFLSRIFLAHDNITKEKVGEFKQHLSTLLEERFRNHWHETCPTKGQAYRCIRVCPEEPLDPILEKVCFEVGINPGDFNLPFELTLWVDPTEVVCKFGDLKCSYHTVAKKDHSSGNLDNQAQNLDIDDLVENARDLYLKKQTVINHPVHSTEMHITNPYSDGTSNGISTAIRINGTMHYASGSPPPGYDGSPRGKGKPAHSIHHKRGGGFHYYGKSSGGKGTYISNGTINSAGSHVTSAHHIYPHHRNHNHHHPHNHHHHGSSGQNATAPYSNGYLNGYGDENGYGYDQRSVSPTKMMNIGTLPAISSAGGPGQISQSSPTPEQIQQQMQHPPPMPPPPPIPPHLHQAFSHAPTDTTTLPPPPPQQPPPSSSATTIDTTSSNSNINSNGAGSGKPSSNGSNSKFQSTRGIVSSRNKQSSPVKVTK